MRVFDRSAVSLSGLCIVHCLVLPAAASTAPVLATAVDAHWVHAAFLAAAALVSAAALAGTRAWRSPGIVVLAVVGLALMALGASHVRPSLEAALTVAGCAFVAGAHLCNMRRVRAARCA